jgi:hypothetical protein
LKLFVRQKFQRLVSITEHRLREALAGRDSVVSSERAVSLLGSTELPAKVELLQAVLEGANEYPHVRRLAAIQLGLLNRPRSQAALLQALGESDARVLGGIVKALSWIGSADTYEPVLSVYRRASGTLAGQAEFAARLIAHRHGLEGVGLPPLRLPASIDFQEAVQQPVEIATAPADSAHLCLESIASRSFSLPLDATHIYRLRCQRGEWMLLFHSDLIHSGPSPFPRSRSIPAAIATWIPESGKYSVAFLVLSEPAAVAESNRLIVCRSSGPPIFSGETRFEGDRSFFSISALVRAGAFPLLFEGSFQSGLLLVKTALSGPVVIPKSRPSPMR